MNEQINTEVQENESTVNMTKVKVKFTVIKYFCEFTNEVKDEKIIGKMTTPECKEFVKSSGDKNVFISREYFDEEFEVPTVELYQLKHS